MSQDLTSNVSVTSRERLLTILNASWMTQAASVAAQLHLAELLSHGPLSPMEIALAVDCHPRSMLRLLRALTSLELVAEQSDGSFMLTDIGALLHPDASGSLAAWAELCGTSSWATWSNLLDSVRTGQTVRKMMRGTAGFEHLDQDPTAALAFNRAMVDLTEPVAAALVRIVDLAEVRTVVDVGGGAGKLLATILAAHPCMRGVLFDLAHTNSMAADLLAKTGVSDRCEVASGSFFDTVPHGADAYLLKSVLHDWNDESCAKILHNCRLAMHPHARLLIIERMMPLKYACSFRDQGIARSDLNMLVGPGGQERTEAEYRTMIAGAGLEAASVLALTDGYSVLEAHCRVARTLSRRR